MEGGPWSFDSFRSWYVVLVASVLFILSFSAVYARNCANAGAQITCRSDSHEISVGEWSGPPRIRVCDSVELAASSLDVGNLNNPGCGLYFWCTNPSVGIDRIQWIIQMKQTYDFWSHDTLSGISIRRLCCSVNKVATILVSFSMDGIHWMLAVIHNCPFKCICTHSSCSQN